MMKLFEFNFASSPDHDYIHWLTGKDGVSAQITLARQQAVQAYPVLANLFFDTPELRKTIDARESLSNAIAKYFSVSKRRVKRLSGLAQKEIRSETDIREILYLPDCAINGKSGQFRKLDIFLKFGIVYYGNQSLTYSPTENLAMVFTHLSKGGDPWRFIDRMEKTDGESVNDAMKFLIVKLFIPAILDRIRQYAEKSGLHWNQSPSWCRDMESLIYPEVVQSVFSFRNMLDWSERYHRNIAHYEDSLEFVFINRTWPGMLGVLDLGNGYIARELTSLKALKTQGLTEKHCVGGYGASVLEGINFNKNGEAMIIFSIEQGDDILGTAAICCARIKNMPFSLKNMRFNLKNRDLRARIRQNLSCGNTSPSRVAVNLAKQIVIEVEQAGSRAFTAYLDGLNRASGAEQADKINPHVLFCGLNPWNQEHIKQVREKLVPALPRKLRKAGLEQLLDKTRIWEKIKDNLLFSESGSGMMNCWNQIDDQGRIIPNHKI